jgi:N-acetylmuramic acid 6-phosphate etherase
MTLPQTELADPRTRDLDAWDTRSAVAAMWEGQMAAVAAVGPALDAVAAAADAAAPRLARGGRLAYAGAGTSGRLGVQDGAELVPTFDWPPDRLVLLMAGGPQALTTPVENAEDDGAAAAAAVAAAALGPDDVLVALAASGTTPYAIAAADAARARGALTIGVACSPGAPLLDRVDHPILAATGPEAVAGSTRMKAGTAQKVVLNLFSTATMVRLGRVHRGLMVDMLARNEKLRRRARRMLAELTGAGPAEVEAALAATGNRVKPAVLLILRGMAPDQADALLSRHGGGLRAALDDR